MRTRLLITATLSLVLISMSPASAATIIGTPGNDTLIGTSGGDTIKGRGGADYLYGKGGADKLYGGNGSDKLYGGPGNDTLNGGSPQWRNRIYGAYGQDHIYASGTDRVFAGNGNDLITVRFGPDPSMEIYCGPGIDHVTFVELSGGVGLHGCENVEQNHGF